MATMDREAIRLLRAIYELSRAAVEGRQEPADDQLGLA
jgi:hypothetical protein